MRRLFRILSILLIVIGLEGGARIWFAFHYDTPGYLLYPWKATLVHHVVGLSSENRDEVLGKRLPPGTHEFKALNKVLHSLPINKSGYRGRDLVDPKTAKWRIVTLGGSSTFSSECPVGHSYPELLESKLNKIHGPGFVQVVNRGLNGVHTKEVEQIFLTEVVGSETDMVTINSAYNAIDQPPVLDLRPGVGPWHRRLLWGRSLFYTALSNSRLNRKAREGYSFESVKTTYRQALESIATVAKKEGIAVVFILQPLLDPHRIRPEKVQDRIADHDLVRLIGEFEGNRKGQLQLLKIMTDIAKKNDIPVVDPRPALYDTDEPEQYFWIALHLTAKGADVMADQIIGQLGEKTGGIETLLGESKGGKQ